MILLSIVLKKGRWAHKRSSGWSRSGKGGCGKGGIWCWGLAYNIGQMRGLELAFGGLLTFEQLSLVRCVTFHASVK